MEKTSVKCKINLHQHLSTIFLQFSRNFCTHQTCFSRKMPGIFFSIFLRHFSVNTCFSNLSFYIIFPSTNTEVSVVEPPRVGRVSLLPVSRDCSKNWGKTADFLGFENKKNIRKQLRLRFLLPQIFWFETFFQDFPKQTIGPQMFWLAKQISPKNATRRRFAEAEEGELFCVDIGGSNSVVLCQRWRNGGGKGGGGKGGGTLSVETNQNTCVSISKYIHRWNPEIFKDVFLLQKIEMIRLDMFFQNKMREMQFFEDYEYLHNNFSSVSKPAHACHGHPVNSLC